MTTQEHDVPKYFVDFVQENARQHQELAARLSDALQENARQHQQLIATISEVKGELKMIKALAVAMVGILAAMAVKYFFGL